MTSLRIMSPALAFNSQLKQAQATGSQAKSTITVTEAKKALTQLTDHPHADGAERAKIVQGFLDGKEGKALSPKAREALVEFVSKQGQEVGGQRAGELKASALKEAKAATGDLDKARDHVTALLGKGMVGKGELATVTKALDSALKNVGDARKNLGSLLKVADHSAALADTELKGAGKEIAQAQKDIASIVARSKGGAVTKAQLTEVREWLAAPRGELLSAQRDLGGSQISTTAKYPSDSEDGGFNGGGPGGGAPGGGMTTRKFPSDNEDGGPAPGGGGGVFHTMKAPSDNEDGGGGPLIHPPKPESVKKERVAKMEKAFNDASAAGNVKWHASMPIGQRFETVSIKRGTTDQDTLDALIPLGAMTPTAPQADPNTVNSFWMKRSGGLTGLSQYAGPFSIK
ncbi:MAG: hypothetical protein Q8O67_10070 [Deltaproteobacteria bacterium]|nr:hypothetical protein [Deltaproteobacteria bacterium]